MSALVGYASSDEDEDNSQADAEPEIIATVGTTDTNHRGQNLDAVASSSNPPISTNPSAIPGPQVGPTIPDTHPEPESHGAAVAPLSPHSTSRQAIRNLTMPPVPSFSIPPSPPGSPPPGSSAKFARFLELKKTGVHFNDRLEKSSALRNPSLLQKLREFADIDDEEQYASTLPDGVAVPTNFPDWTYADQLNRMQQDTTKRKEKERVGQPLEFVPASAAASALASGASSRSGSPGALLAEKNGQKSAAKRVMAGLDHEKWSSGHGAAAAKRTNDATKKSRFDVR